MCFHIAIYEPSCGKTPGENQQCGFRPGLTQIRLCSHRSRLEAWNFGFKKKRKCTIRVVKAKALISFQVTTKLIFVFVFAYADCWFSHEVAHILLWCKKFRNSVHIMIMYTHIRPNNVATLFFFSKLQNPSIKMELCCQ